MRWSCDTAQCAEAAEAQAASYFLLGGNRKKRGAECWVLQHFDSATTGLRQSDLAAGRESRIPRGIKQPHLPPHFCQGSRRVFHESSRGIIPVEAKPVRIFALEEFSSPLPDFFRG